MNHKYFQITEQETLDYIEACIASIGKRDSAVDELTKKLGAYECLQFQGGQIAGFHFNSTPDRAIWKKTKHGYLPKVKTDEAKLVNDLPQTKDYKDAIKKYGFGGEMIIGDRPESGRGFKMHSSYLKGYKGSGFYVIVVPFQDDFDREVHSSLVELKEWEVLKAIDEAA